MAKVLIASIGAGGRDKATNFAYRDATYFRADMPEEECFTPLVFIALKQMYGIDKLILVGTSGSSWMSLYEYLHSRSNVYIDKQHMQYDEDYHFELLEIHENSHKSRLSTDMMRKKLQPLKDALGEFCREICVLEYGTTPGATKKFNTS